MYSLPGKHYDPEILEAISNTIGTFIKIYEKKRLEGIRDMLESVYMDLTKSLPEAINLSWEDKEWMLMYL